MHLGHLGTQALGYLGHLGTWALRDSRHLDTWALVTQGTLFVRVLFARKQPDKIPDVKWVNERFMMTKAAY